MLSKEESMVKVYCYSRCTTCKKALKWLDENKIEYKSVDIKEDHPDEETLKKLHKKSGSPLRKFFNTSGQGQLYRGNFSYAASFVSLNSNLKNITLVSGCIKKS